MEITNDRWSPLDQPLFEVVEREVGWRFVLVSWQVSFAEKRDRRYRLVGRPRAWMQIMPSRQQAASMAPIALIVECSIRKESTNDSQPFGLWIDRGIERRRYQHRQYHWV